MEKIDDHDRVSWTSADNVKMEGFVLASEVGCAEHLCIIGLDTPSNFYGRVVWVLAEDLTLVEKFKSDGAGGEDAPE